MIALLIGGPHDGLFFTVNKDTPWLTDDGELRLPYDIDQEDPRKFAIYSEVMPVFDAAADIRHKRGAYKFSRIWTRPEELT